MIITLAETKTLLGITTSTYDTIIKANIPIVEAVICNECRDDFVEVAKNYYGYFTLRMYKYATTLSFVALTNSMADSASGLATTNFKAGDSVKIYNSLDNEGTFTIKTVAAASIVFEDINTIVDEAAGQNILMVRVKYPTELKHVAAKMLKFAINTKIDMGLKSENIDDYSYQNWGANEYRGGYPSAIMDGLKNHRALFKRSLPTLSEVLL